MPIAAIWTGRILILIGIIGYAYGFYGGNASVTALIPAFFGIVIIALGHLAQAKESLSKHLMHAAMVVGLLGFLLPSGRLAMKFSEITLSAAYLSQISMALVCLIFVLMGVRTFLSARRS
ncbi:MAG: hypothetical protein DWQ47_05030 [Acidobacteria bacterium]|nr:MAG: hypothetical protein DWQ32_08580 [Acidobacteriota bacterium]REK01746.1 MAG: hypothetical protein DWQ38_05015 [Acidobacteriota bacterium]REK14702.1 MAG: hypothetical protein DWQ43_14270 [Acidobacteriota bacterium]REK45417.1 MAG: hypothetical protein DWQ47_05030 [Acidobacteriota bacterium]